MKLSVVCPHFIEGHIIPAEEMYFRLMQRPQFSSRLLQGI